MKTLRERFVIGAILMLITLVVILSRSNELLFVFVLLLSSLEILELFSCLDPENKGRNRLITVIGNAFFQLFAFLRMPELLVAGSVAFFMYLFVLSVVHPYREFEDLFLTLFVVIYNSFFSAFALLFPANMPYGLLLVICVSWGTDTMAYFSGFCFGKTPLTSISPKKTREGAVGGLLGAVALALLFRPLFFTALSIQQLVFIAAVGSLSAQLGDLFASRLKRKMNIKDFGTLLKAHGGIMDRFDSVQFALPTVWLMMRFVTRF